MRAAPAFDPRRHTTRHRAIASRAWQGLLAQEEQSRVFTVRLVADLARSDAPPSIREAARRVAEDEARHVAICMHVVGALGFAPHVPEVDLAPLPPDDARFEQALAEILVAGFAVGETMSVGGFV